MVSFLQLALYLWFYLQFLSAELITFENAVVKNPEYLMLPKYSGDDAPHWNPGKGRSYIDLSHIKVSQYTDKKTISSDKPSNLDIIVFEDKTSIDSWMEHWPDRNFCCNAEMVNKGTCPAGDKNALIIPYSIPGAYRIKASITSDQQISLGELSGAVSHLEIKTTGLYIIILAVCDPDANPVVLNGVIDSLDPYGYLPADEFGDLPFYGTLALCHSLVGIIWAVVCWIYRKDLMFLQLWISIVLAMGMFETTFFFAYYVDWNEQGDASLGLLTFALVLGVVKRMISRLLVLIISLGYGVVRPSLGDDLRKIVILGASYFVLSLIYSLYSSLPDAQKRAVDDPDVDLMSIVILLLMAVEATFYVWIFRSLSFLLDSLAARKQAAKYHLYKGFQSALVFSLLLTCCLGIFAIVQTTMGTPDKEWEDDWLNDGYWELAYFIVFTAIAFLFAPSNNYQRYAHYQQASVGDDPADEDEEMLQHGMDATEAEVDAEYGGRLDEGDDPFGGKGALDVKASVLKKA